MDQEHNLESIFGGQFPDFYLFLGKDSIDK
jgi:hypothetical protein